MKTYDACVNFTNHEFGTANSAHSTGNEFYSYSTVIGYWKDGKVYLNTRKYSVTTSKHQSYLRRAVLSANIPIVEYVAKRWWE